MGRVSKLRRSTVSSLLVENLVPAGDGRLHSGACRVTHGPNDFDFENIAGMTVASVRRSLETIFSIPDDAEAYVGGSVVAPGYRLRPGDAVEFLRRRGRKAVSDLLTAAQLLQRWHITPEQYQQLLQDGLPTIRFGDGTTRHPEIAVDEWLRRRYAPDTACIGIDLKRIADHFDPPPPDKVGSDYIASRLGCTTTWVADMVRRGEIPPHCVVPGTGSGKPWKFFRSRIDSWITSR
jgi:hypothetical protein